MDNFGGLSDYVIRPFSMWQCTTLHDGGKWIMISVEGCPCCEFLCRVRHCMMTDWGGFSGGTLPCETLLDDRLRWFQWRDTAVWDIAWRQTEVVSVEGHCRVRHCMMTDWGGFGSGWPGRVWSYMMTDCLSCFWWWSTRTCVMLHDDRLCIITHRMCVCAFMLHALNFDNMHL